MPQAGEHAQALFKSRLHIGIDLGGSAEINHAQAQYLNVDLEAKKELLKKF